jgi:hypothetical protein
VKTNRNLLTFMVSALIAHSWWVGPFPSFSNAQEVAPPKELSRPTQPGSSNDKQQPPNELPQAVDVWGNSPLALGNQKPIKVMFTLRGTCVRDRFRVIIDPINQKNGNGRI